jgi:hypothetical protein
LQVLGPKPAPEEGAKKSAEKAAAKPAEKKESRPESDIHLQESVRFPPPTVTLPRISFIT